MSGHAREVRSILRELERPVHGCTVTRTSSGHWKVTKPGHQPVIIANSPNKDRAIRNIRADLKRHLGIEV